MLLLSCLSGCPPPRCQWDSVMANSPERTRAAGLSDASAQTEGAINRDLSDWEEPFKDEPGPEAKWRWGGGVVNSELWATWAVFVTRIKIHSCTSNPLKDDMSMETLPRPIYTHCELVSIHLSEHVFSFKTNRDHWTDYLLLAGCFGKNWTSQDKSCVPPIIDIFSALLSVHAFLFLTFARVVREPAAKKLRQHSKELHLWCRISQAKGPACQMNKALFSQLGGCWQMDKQVKRKIWSSQ